MGDWKSWFEDLPHGGFAAQNMSARDGGPARRIAPGPVNEDPWAPLPHPDSPAGGRFFFAAILPDIDKAERTRAVYEAVVLSGRDTPFALFQETGLQMHPALEDALPTISLAAAVLAVTISAGGDAGKSLAAMADEAGEAPMAAAGAGADFDAATALLEFLNLKFLADHLSAKLVAGTQVAALAVERAWDSIDDPVQRDIQIDSAASQLAEAVALLLRGILHSVVGFLLVRGSGARSGQASDLSAGLRRSKLGVGFAEWVDQNRQRILDNPKFRESPAPGGGAA